MTNPLIALVTGASSGFGKCISGRLASSGFRVFGTSRNPSANPENWELIRLDVTSPESIEQCIAEIAEKAGRIDLLVNNAGQSHGSLIEETPLEDARRIFEINFWGAVRMTAAVLPMMREQGAGRIIQVSSLAGLVGTPGQGFYGASKHALEGYTESLRAEIGHLPIHLSLIEPGFFRTGLADSMLANETPLAAYDDLREGLKEKIAEGFAAGGDPEEVATEVLRIATMPHPPFRRRIGKDAKKVSGLKQWLPEKWFLEGVRREFGLGKKS